MRTSMVSHTPRLLTLGIIPNTETQNNQLRPINKLYQTIFNDNIDLFKNFLLYSISSRLKLSDLTVNTKQSLTAFKQKVNQLQGFGFDLSMDDDIKNCDLGINARAMLEDTLDNGKSCINIKEYGDTATKNNNWLNREQIVLYMLHNGYVLIDQGVSDTPPVANAVTILAFQHLLSEPKKVYIANNRRPRLQNNQAQASGTHWFHVVPSNQRSDVIGHNGRSYIRDTDTEVFDGNCGIQAMIMGLNLPGAKNKGPELIANIRKQMVSLTVEFLELNPPDLPTTMQPITTGSATQFQVQSDPVGEASKDSGYEADTETDSSLFPRCEFYHRYGNTSIFPNEVNRAHVYTRSDKARYYSGNSNNTKFIPRPLTDPQTKLTDSLSAHTGGFANPYILSSYSKNIKLQKYDFNRSKYPLGPKLYDELLNYKLQLCKYIANKFREKVPVTDLGIGIKYNAKIISGSDIDYSYFSDANIIVCKYKVKKQNYIDLYILGPNKTPKYINLSDNQKFINELWAIKVKSNNKLEELLKKYDKYLKSKGVFPRNDQGVYCSNSYPCILVKFTPRINDKHVGSDIKTLTTFYKRYNHLLMAYFIAIVDYNAYTAGIQIEMLGRSSFGHNNPSIAVTEKSFRINIGLVPKEYADIIVRSLAQLYTLFCMLENEKSVHLPMYKSLQNRLNKGRLVGFKQPNISDTYWESLWVKGSHGPNGRNMICELIERKRDRPELLANFVLETIIANPINFFNESCIAELPLEKMFNLVSYTPDQTFKNKGKKLIQHHISVNSKKILSVYPEFKASLGNNKKISQDPALLTIVQEICKGLAIDLPPDLGISSLYKFLEKAHLQFILEKRTRTTHQLETISEWGSDSDTEEQNFVKTMSVFAKKVIVANGMLAINLAYYAARIALCFIEAVDQIDNDDVDAVFQEYQDKMDINHRKISIDCENTYFETKNCLSAATNPPSYISNKKGDILFFDLNSFNADFIAQNVSLEDKLDEVKPTIVVLDHTSSTTNQIGEAVKIIFQNHPSVLIVLLVTSGLKNEQGGADNNPYGKVTILSLGSKGETNTLTNFLYEEITVLTNPEDRKLSTMALLSLAGHAVRHSYKDRGFTTTTSDILNIKLDNIFKNLNLKGVSTTLYDTNRINSIIYVLTLRDILVNYEDNFTSLSEAGVPTRDIVDLYKESEDKFIAMSQDKIINLITDSDMDASFDELSDIYDEEQELFKAIIDDEEGLIEQYGFEGFCNTYRSEDSSEDDYEQCYNTSRYERTYNRLSSENNPYSDNSDKDSE